MDPSADLDRMERKIRSSEAHAAALTEMGDESYEAQFQELDDDSDIEAQLQALKGGASADAPVGELPQGTADPGAPVGDVATAQEAPSEVTTSGQ
jgi:phage shock protein A